MWTQGTALLQVLATSRGDYRALAAGMGVKYFGDVNDFCEEHPDVVVFATSILSLEAVVSSLPVQRLKRSTLFVDVLSVKAFPKRLMLSLLPPEVGSCPPPTPSDPHTPSCMVHVEHAADDCALIMHASDDAPVIMHAGAWFGACAWAPFLLKSVMQSSTVCQAQAPLQCQSMAAAWAQVDILCTHPMFGPDSGAGSWQGLNLMFERVRVGGQAPRQQRAARFLQVWAPS